MAGSGSDPNRFGVEQARRRLPELLARAASGERFVLCRHHHALAVLGPVNDPEPQEPGQGAWPVRSLLQLQGSGRHCWEPTSTQPIRPTPSPIPYVQPVKRHHTFDPRLLQQGSRVALDGSALVAFLADAKGTGTYLGPLMEGIAQGYWQGVISTVSLMRVLEGPLACGDETLAQRYSMALAHGGHWQQIAPNAALVEAATRLQQQEPQLDSLGALELATAIRAGAAVLVTDHPALAQTGQLPVLSAQRL
jgi:antitoxin (DNA-binding transcriptional repressor) of toxin-antitoxin stability system